MDLATAASQARMMGKAKNQQVLDWNAGVDRFNLDVGERISALKQQKLTDASKFQFQNYGQSLVQVPRLKGVADVSKEFLVKRGAYNPEAAAAGKYGEVLNLSKLRGAPGAAVAEATAASAARGERILAAGRQVVTAGRQAVTAGREAVAVAGGGVRGVAAVAGKAGVSGLEAVGKGGLSYLKSAGGQAAEAVLEKQGLKALGKVAGVVNVGFAGEALAEDFKGGLHFAGNNAEEKWANGLQIASGAADLIGLAFPPVALLGAGLSLLSGVLEQAGQEQEAKEKAESVTEKDVGVTQEERDKFGTKKTMTGMQTQITARATG
jgi:hypothetical protein